MPAGYFEHWSTLNTASVLIVLIWVPLVLLQVRFARKCRAIERLPEHLRGFGGTLIPTKFLPKRLNENWRKFVAIQALHLSVLAAFTLWGGYAYFVYVNNRMANGKSFLSLRIFSPVFDYFGPYGVWLVILPVAGIFLWWSVNMFRTLLAQIQT